MKIKHQHTEYHAPSSRCLPPPGAPARSRSRLCRVGVSLIPNGPVVVAWPNTYEARCREIYNTTHIQYMNASLYCYMLHCLYRTYLLQSPRHNIPGFFGWASLSAGDGRHQDPDIWQVLSLVSAATQLARVWGASTSLSRRWRPATGSWCSLFAHASLSHHVRPCHWEYAAYNNIEPNSIFLKILAIDFRKTFLSGISYLHAKLTAWRDYAQLVWLIIWQRSMRNVITRLDVAMQTRPDRHSCSPERIS